jgi:hypothetical protein
MPTLAHSETSGKGRPRRTQLGPERRASWRTALWIIDDPERGHAVAIVELHDGTPQVMPEHPWDTAPLACPEGTALIGAVYAYLGATGRAARRPGLGGRAAIVLEIAEQEEPPAVWLDAVWRMERADDRTCELPWHWMDRDLTASVRGRAIIYALNDYLRRTAERFETDQAAGDEASPADTETHTGNGTEPKSPEEDT